MKHTCTHLLLLMLLAIVCPAWADETYRVITTQDGLSSNRVYQMLQLADGRLVINTDKQIDIYDGQRFSNIDLSEAYWTELSGYNGHTHLYVDGEERLWIKKYRRICCIDLRTLRLLSAPDELPSRTTKDFYVDTGQRIWWVADDRISDPKGRWTMTLPADSATREVQDVDVQDSTFYAFLSSGQVAAFDLASGQCLYVRAAYTEEEREQFDATSLIIHDGRQTFYQIRTGRQQSVLLAFDTQRREWRRLLTYDGILHTLFIGDHHTAYLTTPDGYLRIDLTTGQRETLADLRLPDGTRLNTGINTVCQDREGGLWLGTYDTGLLYLSPLSGLFDTRALDVRLRPILTDIYLHGEPIQRGQTYDGEVLTRVATPYVERLTLNHAQNSVAFRFSAMNFARPRTTCYRYRFTSAQQTSDWQVVTATTADKSVDDHGTLYLSFTALPTGRHRLEVMASTHAEHWDDAQVKRIEIEVLAPWWSSLWAFIAYAAFVILAGIVGQGLYRAARRRRRAQERKEEELLARIRELVEQVNRYATASADSTGNEADDETWADAPTLSPQEREFLARATALVEQHLADPQYSVERLSSDLCMERTGLYKKLTAMMDTSPVTFIRSIRLTRAAALLAQHDKSVAEVAELTGFSSVSYFSKCFQREFGCKPSDYSAPEA